MDTFLARGRVHSSKTVSDTDAGLHESVCAENSLQNRLTHVLTHNRICCLCNSKWQCCYYRKRARLKSDSEAVNDVLVVHGFSIGYKA